MPPTCHRPSRAFTLLEVLIVLVVVGILTGLMIPYAGSGAYARLQSAAAILGRDVEYARDLAVTNADNYKITFDVTGNRWVLTHSGTNSALDALPITSTHRYSDPSNQRVVDLDELPEIGGAARLYAVWALSNPPQEVNNIEFLPLGETTRAEPTLIWLAAGSGTGTRYVAVRINPTTGLYWVEGYRSTVPSIASYVGS